MTQTLSLDPRLRPGDYRAAYARDGVVRIEGLFPVPVAETLATVLERATPWSLVHSGAAGEHIILDPPALARASPQELG